VSKDITSSSTGKIPDWKSDRYQFLMTKKTRDTHALEIDKKRQFVNEDRKLQISSAHNGWMYVI
jgi:hypothetical protein